MALSLRQRPTVSTPPSIYRGPWGTVLHRLRLTELNDAKNSYKNHIHLLTVYTATLMQTCTPAKGDGAHMWSSHTLWTHWVWSVLKQQEAFMVGVELLFKGSFNTILCCTCNTTSWHKAQDYIKKLKHYAAHKVFVLINNTLLYKCSTTCLATKPTKCEIYAALTWMWVNSSLLLWECII